MKNAKVKNNKVYPNFKKRRGFALLFSVLISSLLLTIGLSIFSIALKELAISTASRQSISAFYAADSGLEYALYRDTKKGNFPDVTTALSQPAINLSDSASLPVIAGDTEGPNFSVTVLKYRNPASSTTDKISTSITSTGYDSNAGDKTQREIQETY